MADIIRMDMTVEDRRAFQALKRLAGGFKAMTAEEKKAVKEAKELERAHKKLGREGKRIYEQSMTAAQRYRRQVESLRQAKKMGILTERQHAQAISFTRQEMRMAGDAGRRAFGPQALSSIRNIASALGIVGGVAGAVRLVRMEYDKLLEVQQRAKETSLTAADAEIKMVRNLSVETEKERDEVLESVKIVAARLRIPASVVNIALSEALSARGSLQIPAALAAIEPAIQIAPESASTAQALAGAALDIQKIAPGTTPQSAIGFMLEGLKKSRVVDTEKFAIAAPRAASAAVLRGGTPREGVALLSALTQSMVDKMGRQAVTASLQVINQLKEPKEFEGADRLRAAPGLSAALDLLKEDVVLRKAFLDKASFQEKAKASVELLVSGGRVREDFEQFKRELPRAAEAGPAFERKRVVQAGTPLQRTAAFERGIQATIERVRTTDPTRARLGILREHLGPLLEDTGSSRLATKLANLTVTGTGLEGYVRRLEQRIQELERTQFVMTVSPDAMGLGVGAVARGHTPVELEQVRALQAAADMLRELIQQNQQPTLGQPGTNEMLGTDPHDK